MFEKYNGQGSIVSYAGSGNANSFNILTNGESKTYNLAGGLEAGSIKVIKQYSPTEAVVALVHDENNQEKKGHTTVVLFSLESGTNLKVSKIPFPVDNVFKLNDAWVGIATVGDDDESNVKVQVVFSGDENPKIYQEELPRALRVWNDYFPILTVSYEHKETEEKQRQILTTVKCAPKRSIYINFMEQTGTIDNFGSEIVKEVVNNFN